MDDAALQAPREFHEAGFLGIPSCILGARMLELVEDVSPWVSWKNLYLTICLSVRAAARRATSATGPATSPTRARHRAGSRVKPRKRTPEGGDSRGPSEVRVLTGVDGI